jgi:hypothetical protein
MNKKVGQILQPLYNANRGTTGSTVSRVLASDLDALSTFLKSKFNYDPGEYENYSLETVSKKD